MSETAIDDFDLAIRRQALEDAAAESFPAAKPIVNVHAHTFFSFNYRGYSPSHFALESKRRGLAVSGIVEFDCLDGLDEFLAAGRLLDLKTSIGLESRVYLPEFGDREINSPGEPGISYHMGIGFSSTDIPEEAQTYMDGMRATSAERNRGLVDRVNSHLDPVVLDYETDVLPLTPSGNATERHICVAFGRKAATQFPDEDALARFWANKLGVPADQVSDLPDGRELTNLLRAKTMKSGGVGYVQPDSGSFPHMADMNRFVLLCGAIPALTWLDGCSAGEQAIEELIEVATSTGVAAFNVIPDRNYTPGSPDQKLQNLKDVVAITERRGLPLIGGTEMNSPGQRFVDDFNSDALDPLRPAFLKGAHILYAHTVLQGMTGMGYLSDWAENSFSDVFAKNDFFNAFGETFSPRGEDRLRESLSSDHEPDEVLTLAQIALT
ncbi:MAG: hypothetical protein VCA36_01395 [Opitutales bacterium]